MTDEGTLGLREQKRVATRRALQVALLEMSIERGFENVTVEEVGRAAQVSPRTFFNYFTSKEDAVVGRGKPFEPGDEAIERFRRSTGDVIGDLVDLMAASTATADDPAVHALRRRLLEQEPGLLGVQIAGAHRLEERLAGLVASRLRAAEAAARGGQPAVSDRARLLALVAGAIMRSGWSRWVAEEGARPLPDCIRSAYAEFRRECGGMVGPADGHSVRGNGVHDRGVRHGRLAAVGGA